MPKTASTSIQRTLLENRKILETQSWVFPVFTCPESGVEFFPHNDPLSRLFFPSHPFHVERPVNEGLIDLQKQQKGITQQFDHYCNSSENLILSSEVLLNPSALKKIKEHLFSHGYKVEPILYVRSPYSYRVSHYQSILKFSQNPRSIIMTNLRTPIIESTLKSVIAEFGDTVAFFPFSFLVRKKIDIVHHFFTHLLGEKAAKEIIISRKNEALSWQATSLLEYIEDHCPSYVDNVRNKQRFFGDVLPLHNVKGDKFKLAYEQFKSLESILEQENWWLAKNLGEEYCDEDFTKMVAQELVVWKKEHCQSLLTVFPEIPLHVQRLIEQYMRLEACFSSFSTKMFLMVGIYNNIARKIAAQQYRRLKGFSFGLL
jgi:hypothetical protein